MRISDWSSDVCSSDLMDVMAHEAENADRVRLQKQSVKRNADRRRGFLKERLQRAEQMEQKISIQLTRGGLRKHEEQTGVALARLDSRQALHARRDGLEIGRESCRARGGPYV